MNAGAAVRKRAFPLVSSPIHWALERAARVSLVALGVIFAVGVPWVAFVESSAYRPLAAALGFVTWLGALWRYAYPGNLLLVVRGDELVCTLRRSTHRLRVGAVCRVAVSARGTEVVLSDERGRIQLSVGDLDAADAKALAADVRAFLRTCGASVSEAAGPSGLAVPRDAAARVRLPGVAHERKFREQP